MISSRRDSTGHPLLRAVSVSGDDLETTMIEGPRRTNDLSGRPQGSRPADWRDQLPVLRGDGVTLRELAPLDVPTLLSMVTGPEVARFIAPPPPTLDGFEKFVAWSHRQRKAGSSVGFAVVPDGYDAAVGLFQLRTLEPGSFDTAEWGFALGSEFWGRGIFPEAARLVLGFAFETLGAHRLEARAAVRNGRGNGALRKLGAVTEGVLRQSFLRDGQYTDQILWAILDSDWQRARDHATASVH